LVSHTCYTTLEPVNNASFGGIVRRHLHFHPVANCKPNKAFAHLPGNVGKNEMIVSERDAKHRSGKHRHDDALQFNRLIRIHAWSLGTAIESIAVELLPFVLWFTSACLQTSADHRRREDAVAPRADALHLRLTGGR